jgi:uncharacterized protein
VGRVVARAIGAQALLALFAAAAPAAPYHPPPLTGHVVDTASLLAPSERLALDRRMEEIRTRSGFELVAFLVGSLEDRPIEDVAYGAFNQWGVGRERQDNGVLLVIAPRERKVRIETGRGVGGVLTDVQASDIIERVIAPPLRAGRYARAVADGVDAIAATLTTGTAPASSTLAPQRLRISWPSLAVVAALLALFIVLLIVWRGFRSAMWSVLQVVLIFRILGGGRGGGGGGSGYSGGGGSSGGGGASGGY